MNMTDLQSITSVLATTKHLTDLAKLIKGSFATLKDAELNLKITEMAEKTMQLREQVMDVKEELFKRQEEVQDLKEKLALKDKLVFKEFAYFDGEGGAFCQPCFDAKKIQSNLHDSGRGYWECKICKTAASGEIPGRILRTPFFGAVL
jgi:hypothetical protein